MALNQSPTLGQVENRLANAAGSAVEYVLRNLAGAGKAAINAMHRGLSKAERIASLPVCPTEDEYAKLTGTSDLGALAAFRTASMQEYLAWYNFCVQMEAQRKAVREAALKSTATAADKEAAAILSTIRHLRITARDPVTTNRLLVLRYVPAQPPASWLSTYKAFGVGGTNVVVQAGGQQHDALSEFSVMSRRNAVLGALRVADTRSPIIYDGRTLALRLLATGGASVLRNQLGRVAASKLGSAGAAFIADPRNQLLVLQLCALVADVVRAKQSGATDAETYARIIDKGTEITPKEVSLISAAISNADDRSPASWDIDRLGVLKDGAAYALIGSDITRAGLTASPVTFRAQLPRPRAMIAAYDPRKAARRTLAWEASRAAYQQAIAESLIPNAARSGAPSDNVVSQATHGAAMDRLFDISIVRNAPGDTGGRGLYLFYFYRSMRRPGSGLRVPTRDERLSLLPAEVRDVLQLIYNATGLDFLDYAEELLAEYGWLKWAVVGALRGLYNTLMRNGAAGSRTANTAASGAPTTTNISGTSVTVAVSGSAISVTNDVTGETIAVDPPRVGTAAIGTNAIAVGIQPVPAETRASFTQPISGIAESAAEAWLEGRQRPSEYPDLTAWGSTNWRETGVLRGMFGHASSGGIGGGVSQAVIDRYDLGPLIDVGAFANSSSPNHGFERANITAPDVLFTRANITAPDALRDALPLLLDAGGVRRPSPDSTARCKLCATIRDSGDPFAGHSGLQTGTIYTSPNAVVELAEMQPGDYGELFVDGPPFRIRVNVNEVSGRARLALAHELTHMLDLLVKSNLSHEQVVHIANLLVTDVVPAMNELNARLSANITV